MQEQMLGHTRGTLRSVIVKDKSGVVLRCLPCHLKEVPRPAGCPHPAACLHHRAYSGPRSKCADSDAREHTASSDPPPLVIAMGLLLGGALHGAAPRCDGGRLPALTTTCMHNSGTDRGQLGIRWRSLWGRTLGTMPILHAVP